MMGNRTLGFVLGAAVLGSALPRDVFGNREDDFTFACSIVVPLTRIPGALEEYVSLLPEQAPPGKPWEGQPFWKGISNAFASLAGADLEGQTATALVASLGEGQSPENLVESFITYGKSLLASLGAKGGILWTLAGNLRVQIWPSVYDPSRRRFTTFGLDLHRVYAQSLANFAGLYHLSKDQKSFLLELPGKFFGTKGAVPAGSSAGWAPEPTEALCAILLDLQLIYDLSWGKNACTYNLSFLSNQKKLVKQFWVLHLTRFAESLSGVVQTQREAVDDPFGGAEVPDESASAPAAALQGSAPTGPTRGKRAGASSRGEESGEASGSGERAAASGSQARAPGGSSGSTATTRVSIPVFPGD
ncbi:MAG: hypothetical protein LBD54_02345 [Puniceicoccales bacterium]|jgi:hypothetical protein|nr:hypothetical protein [Puniceicoccales bacterium]